MGLGAVVYVAGLNRVMNYLPDGTYKPILVLVTFSTLLGCLAYVSYVVQPLVWEEIILAGASILGLNELYRIWLRQRLQAEAPAQQRGLGRSLTRPFTTTDLQVLEYQVRLLEWRGQRLRVAQLSDLHVNGEIPLSYYLSVVELVNQAQPDLILITGDFVSELEFLPLLPQILGGLKSRLGVYAILGNHDYWSDAAQTGAPDARHVAEMVSSLGIHLIRDGQQWVQVDDATRLMLFGCEAPWSKNRCLRPILAAGELALGLSHTADHIYHLSGSGVAAVFSGHYHGGQFNLPGWGAVFIPSAYGRRFERGHFLVNGTHLFVSTGVAAARPVFRLYCPPDIVVVDFSA